MFSRKEKSAAVNPSELFDYINTMAKQEGISFSEAVRRALTDENLQTRLEAVASGKTRAA